MWYFLFSLEQRKLRTLQYFFLILFPHFQRDTFIFPLTGPTRYLRRVIPRSMCMCLRLRPLAASLASCYNPKKTKTPHSVSLSHKNTQTHLSLQHSKKPLFLSPPLWWMIRAPLMASNSFCILILILSHTTIPLLLLPIPTSFLLLLLLPLVLSDLTLSLLLLITVITASAISPKTLRYTLLPPY